MFLRTFSQHVTLLAMPGAGLEAGDIARMEAAGVEMVCESVVTIDPNTAEPGIEVQFADGSRRRFDVLYPMQGCAVCRRIWRRRWARSARDDGDLLVDASLCTSVPGLYAIGDVTSAINQISVALGHAATAATTIHRRLPPNYR